MLKNYINSYLSIDLSKWLALPTAVIFVLIFVYPKHPLPILRVVLIIFAILLAIALGFHYFKKFQMGQKIRKIEQLEKYDTAVMLGQQFLAEDKILVYQNMDIFEKEYSQLKSVKKEPGKKDQVLLRCVFDDKEVVIPTGSLLQAQRTVAFLKKKNDAIECIDIEPTGDGQLHTIDQIRIDSE